MSLYSDTEVRQYLINRYSTPLQARGMKPGEVPDNFDFLQEGIIDSLGIMELVTDVETHFGHPIDFEELDAEKMTVLGPLTEHIQRKLLEARNGSVVETNDLSQLPKNRFAIKGHAIEAWLASDDREIRKGLMGIEASALTTLADGTERGMLFTFPSERPLSFWMFKTIVPLDIAYLDANRRIINWHSAKALETRLLYPSQKPAQYVLEVNAHVLERWGVKPGDLLEPAATPSPVAAAS